MYFFHQAFINEKAPSLMIQSPSMSFMLCFSIMVRWDVSLQQKRMKMAVSLSSAGCRAATPHRLAGHRELNWRRRRRWSEAAAMASLPPEEVEIRVCVNRSCGRQGSRETLAALSSLAPPGVSVSSCGCLGRCGSGPNVAITPPGAIVGHCGTASKAARLLAELCGPEFDPERNLEALALRRKAEDELEKGNAEEAEGLLSQAIALQPSGALHVMHKSRSAARLAMGNNVGALEDAEESSRLAPKFAQAYISQGDAYFKMEKWDCAEEAYSTALHLDPSLRRSKSFKARVTELQEKLVGSNGLN